MLLYKLLEQYLKNALCVNDKNIYFHFSVKPNEDQNITAYDKVIVAEEPDVDVIKGPDMPISDSGADVMDQDVIDQTSPEHVIDNPDVEDVLQLAHRSVFNLYSYLYSKSHNKSL